MLDAAAGPEVPVSEGCERAAADLGIVDPRGGADGQLGVRDPRLRALVPGHRQARRVWIVAASASSPAASASASRYSGTVLAGSSCTSASRTSASARSTPGGDLVSRSFEQARSRGRCRRRGRAGRRRGRDGVAHRPRRPAASAGAPAPPGRRPRPTRRAREPPAMRPRGSRRSRDSARRSRARGGEHVPRRRSDLGEPRVQRCRRDGVRRTATADPSSGWVNLMRSRSSSRMPAASASCEPGLVAGADRRLHERDRRLGERCDRGGDLERVGSDAVEAHAQELVEAGRNREILARRERAAAALERGRELEREERVAARGLPELDQHRPGERRAEAIAQAAHASRRGSGRRHRTVRSRSSGTARRTHSGTSSRTASTAATCSWSRRATANRSAESDAESSHWTSSTARQRARSAASRRSAPRNAAATARGRRVAPTRRAAAQPRAPVAGSAAARARRRRRPRRGCPSAPGTRTPPLPPRVETTGHEIRGGSVLDAGEPQCRLADPGSPRPRRPMAARRACRRDRGVLQLLLPPDEVRNADLHLLLPSLPGARVAPEAIGAPSE